MAAPSLGITPTCGCGCVPFLKPVWLCHSCWDTRGDNPTTVDFLSRGISEGNAGIPSHFLQHLQQSQCDLGGNCDHTPLYHYQKQSKSSAWKYLHGLQHLLWSKGKQGREAINQEPGLQITCTQPTPGTPLPASGKTKQVLLISPAASAFTC